MALPETLIVLYWLSCSSPASSNFACPSLQDITCFTDQQGRPQANVVSLFSAHFTGTPDAFEPPYVAWDDSMTAALESGHIEHLQAKGVKVMLSIVGTGGDTGIGWGCIPQDKNAALASWMRSEIVDKYGLDGIDIDDEWGCPGNTDSLVTTVAAVRGALDGKLLSKALWDDHDDFNGTDLGQLLDFGSTMSYGWPAEVIEQSVDAYNQVGLPYDKITIGVQAGPPDQAWMTSLQTTQRLTEWAKAKPIRGMMLFSFTQDIQQFTHSPQHEMPYPSPNDHEWQQKIVETWWSPSAWVVQPNCACATRDVDAGPIYNQQQAQQRCPGVCTQAGASWNGQWVTRGATSYCGCQSCQ